MPTVALSLCQDRFATAIWAGDRVRTLAEVGQALGRPLALSDDGLSDRTIARLYLGNEFCETLLPRPGGLERALRCADAAGVPVTLLTPMLSDEGHDRLRALLPRLPEDSEVVANDWGTLALLRREHPRLRPVIGRLLCKMIKDPRLPSAEWARLYPHGIFSEPFRRMVEGFGVQRIEIDVPPYVQAEDLRCDGLSLSVHAPYGFATKGRACKIGSLGLEDGAKFAIGHSCRKECLTHVGVLEREGGAASADLRTFQRGTTVFYRHSPAMAQAVRDAAARGWIDRIVLSGDWNEDHGTDQPH